MDEIYNLKPESIFDVADESVFFERKDIEHKGYINSGNCYELYYAISKYYNPDTILEIGTRNGYSLYSMMLGSEVLSKVVGYDKNMDYTVVTRDNLSSHVPDHVQFEIRNEDTQTLSELDDVYRLVHIDADKSYEGTYHDLELTFKKARVVLVGDIGLDSDERSARDAVLRYCYDKKDFIKQTHLIESHNGIYIIEYKG